ncbi:uncharacterized protein [Lepeophtheirus salmonis]|uniref:uncharacterized protein n=1 Tax=Lepeophtheirus salmonis TaxID=72036 RepID=UPI001AE26FD4|nr:uncharacterized protein LOC121125219 [Lepeophtheirus salmonis]
MLRLCRFYPRGLCTPMYESIEELVKAHTKTPMKEYQRQGIYHPRLERNITYFRNNLDRYPYVLIPPPDKHVLAFLKQSTCMESILMNVASPDQSLKMFEILASFSDSLPLGSPILEKCCSILLSQTYSFRQLLDFVSTLSKVNAKRLYQNAAFPNVVDKFMDKSIEALQNQKSKDLTLDRAPFFRLAYLWTRYHYSLSPNKVKNCPFTTQLLKRILSDNDIVRNLDKQEIVFVSFLIGNLRHSPYVMDFLLNHLVATVQQMEAEEISIISTALFLSKVKVHQQDALVTSLLNKLLMINPNDVSTIERVLGPVSKLLKKASLVHIEKKKDLAFRFGPVLQYLSINTRIHFLKFLSINGTLEVRKSLKYLVDSFSSLELNLDNLRMKDWESIVQSLVLLNYKDEQFYLKVAEDIIDSCKHQNHHHNIKSLINLVLYLTHEGIYKKSSIDKIFKLVNNIDLSKSVPRGLVSVLYADSGTPSEYVHAELIKSKHTYTALVRNILELDSVLNVFITEDTIQSRLNPNIREAFVSHTLKFDDPTSGTKVAENKQTILKCLNLHEEGKDYLSSKICPHFRSEDIIICYNDRLKKIEKFPKDFDSFSPPKSTSESRYIVLLVTKRINLLHNQVFNGYLNFQKDLLHKMGYDVVIITRVSNSPPSLRSYLYRSFKNCKEDSRNVHEPLVVD